MGRDNADRNRRENTLRSMVGHAPTAQNNRTWNERTRRDNLILLPMLETREAVRVGGGVAKARQ